MNFPLLLVFSVLQLRIYTAQSTGMTMYAFSSNSFVLALVFRPLMHFELNRFIKKLMLVLVI